MSGNLKGKRKKAVPQNANPLFTKWITEWKEEAVSKGWKSQYNYSKALRTLKLFPLCLESGKDCKMLQNFGDKICKMLDEKLADYRQHQDIGMIDKEINVDPGAPKLSSTTGTTTSKDSGPAMSSSSTLAAIHAISDSDSGKEEQASPQKKKRRKPSGTRSREYVPAYRSGPYALILTLFRHSHDPDYKGFLIKAELMHAAQRLSDKSFFLPDAGSHYTAWSSMGSLIKRGLVSKIGSPARFSLTPEGFDLGQRLENAEQGENNFSTSSTVKETSEMSQASRSSNEKNNFKSTSSIESHSFCSNEILKPHEKDDNQIFVLSDEDDNIDYSFQSKSPVRSRVSKAHSLSPCSSGPASPTPCTSYPTSDLTPSHDVFTHETEQNNNVSVCVIDYDDDEFGDDDVNITGISQASPPKRVRLPSLSTSDYLSQDSNMNSPSKSNHARELFSKTQSTDNFKEDIIEIDDDDDVDDNGADGKNYGHNRNISSSFIPKKSIFGAICRSSQSSQSDDEDLPDLDFDIPLSKRLLNKGNINSQLLSSCFSQNQIIDDSAKAIPKSTQNVNNILPKQPNRDNVTSGPDKPFTSILPMSKGGDQSGKQNLCLGVVNSIPATVSSSVKEIDTVTSKSPPAPLFTFLPGTYEIVLCVDNREFYGSKSSSKTLLPDLMQSGVTCDLRLLHIGDILWVAREKVDPNDPSRAQRKELVLNFAIERKRMDDLVSSITGGRLKEQKFRLKHCGLSELIILIEEYGSIQNFSISEDRIKQSIVNSQILDGFKVKKCGSSKEAVGYLSMMTRCIQKYYSNKTLHASSHEYVKATAPQTTIQDREYYLLTFESFNEASVKQKALTVKEMFGKHLIQVPGVSLERACAITRLYPTLRSLMKAYEECSSDKSRENLLSGIKCGNKERNLGVAVSRTLHLIYKQTQTLL